VVAFQVPAAVDAIDGPVAVACNWPSGAFFPIGTTVVTCSAADLAGNVAAVAFAVTVLAPPTPVPTEPPPPTAAPTQEPPPQTPAPDPTESPEPTSTATSEQSPSAEPTAPVDNTDTTDPPTPAGETPSDGAPSGASAEPGETPASEPSATPEASPTASATPGEPRDPLALPWPPPPGFIVITGSGPIGGLAAIWGDLDFPISQEYGHTPFSVAHPGWYAYGGALGLDGYAHPGIDIGMPAGTPLYSPVTGTVTVAGGTPYYTFYGNGQPGVGHLQIETDAGDIVILGHMGRIVVDVGQRVAPGEFVGLSGGENGDHLHLETRERQPGGGYRAVDPRESFLVAAIANMAPFQMTDGQVTIEAEAAQESIARGDDSWAVASDQPGYNGEGFVAAGPDTRDSVLADYAESSPQLRFTVDVPTPGTYTLWLRGSAPGGGSDSIHYGLDGVGLTSRYGTTGFGDGPWTWVAGQVAVVIDAPGAHVVELWMREDGLRLDSLILSSDPDFVPGGAGTPAEAAPDTAADAIAAGGASSTGNLPFDTTTALLCESATDREREEIGGCDALGAVGSDGATVPTTSAPTWTEPRRRILR